jgi:small-conductance mechanosensitive channel
LCWAYRPDVKGKLIHQLNRDIYKAFNKAGIGIPFPQRDVHLIKAEDDEASPAEGMPEDPGQAPPPTYPPPDGKQEYGSNEPKTISPNDQNR